MDERYSLYHTKLISQEEAEKIFSEIAQVQMARSLVELFRRASDSTTYRLEEDSNKTKVYSRVKPEEIRASISLSQIDKYTTLDFYDNLPEKILDCGWMDGICNKFATISAGPKRTGVWAYGLGHEAVYGIAVEIPNGVILPSKMGRWFFNLMSWFALMSSEFNLKISEQPKIWIGDKKQPD